MPINLPESDFTSDSTWLPSHVHMSNVGVCVCLMYKHAWFGYQISMGKHLKCNFQLYLGCPFCWWKQICHQIQNSRQMCPPCQMFSHALFWGPNIIEKELRSHFQLTMVWPFCLWNHIWPQIQYGCSPPCLMFKHAQFGYLSHRVEKPLRCHFKLSLGCPFSWWNLEWP